MMVNKIFIASLLCKTPFSGFTTHKMAQLCKKKRELITNEGIN